MSRAFVIQKRNVIEHLALAGNLARNPKFWLVLVSDILLLLASLYGSCYLRYEQFALQGMFALYLQIFFLILLIKLPVFYVFGLYRGVWRYTGIRDVVNIVKAIGLSSVLLLTTLLYLNRFAGFSRSVFILDMIFTFVFIAGSRLCIRIVYRGIRYSDARRKEDSTFTKKRLLLLGAGDVAEKVLRELRSDPNLPYEPVGLLDDNLSKVGRRIHGVPVLGTIANLEKHVQRSKAQEVLITESSPGSNEMKQFVELCTVVQVPFKVIPQYSEIVDDNFTIRSIRNISYRDLLGRKEMKLEQEKIKSCTAGTCVLVTGAGGSIGSELCRQLMQFTPARLILFDSSEENLYTIEMELLHNRIEPNQTEIIAVLGRVQDVNLVQRIFSRYQPATVFHGAAYKHVPLVEHNPWEVAENNIMATRVLVEAAILYGAERFVLISTDKAVRPTSVMGASKRCAELLIKAYDGSSWDGSFSATWPNEDIASFRKRASSGLSALHETRFMAVRFGNVIGSSGSVIPLFSRQIEKGGPVTITHPDMSRFFMLVEEAAQLTLQAGAMGSGGEIFILRMGRPIKIEHMARAMIRLAGKKPEKDIPIIYTSLRDGEKLHEELITEGEGIVATEHDKIMVLKGGTALMCRELNLLIERLAAFASECNGSAIKLTLQEMIPEYIPDLNSSSVVDPTLAGIERRLPN